METELIIEGTGFPPLSARGCQQELTLVPQGTFRRTVNGNLCYLGPVGDKYHSVIRCEDKAVLAHDGVLRRGSLVRIGCLQRLWQQATSDEEKMIVRLERPAVVESIGVINNAQEPVSFTVINNQTLSISASGAVFISYRPWLDMRVLSLKLYTDEWGLKTGWQLESEEA